MSPLFTVVTVVVKVWVRTTRFNNGKLRIFKCSFG